MKTLSIAFVLLTASSLANAGNTKSTFRGEVSDTQCAMNVHSLKRSHEEMIQKSTLGTNAASCARACVRRGGEWVLRSGDEIYRLKNQSGIEEYAGQEVQVSGTLDPKTNTIDNDPIKPGAAKGTPPE
jgi:hypothetical protein